MSAAAACPSFELVYGALAEFHRQLLPKDDYCSLSLRISALKKDWYLLGMLWEGIQLRNHDAAAEFSDHGQVGGGESLSQLVLKIEAAAEEIAQDIIDIKEKKKSQYSKFVDFVLLNDCESKTSHLKAEIGGAFDGCSASGCCPLIQVHPPADFFLWKTFLDSVQKKLQSMLWLQSEWRDENSRINRKVSNLVIELQWVGAYINWIYTSDPEFSFLAAKDGGDPDHVADMVDALLVQVTSVAAQAAIQVSNYEFICNKDPTIAAAVESKLTKLAEDLHHEIDPTNPNFMGLHLNFLKALKKFGYQGDAVNDFCRYLFKFQLGDFEQEMSSLIICFLHNKITDVVLAQSLFAEINAVLRVMASLVERERIRGEYIPLSGYELLTKMCLLKAEFYLREQLFLPAVLSAHRTDQLKQIIGNLRRFSQALPQEKIEYGKKVLAFVEQVAKELASLRQSFEAKKITESMLNSSILQLLLKIVIFRAESFLMELLLLIKSDAETSFMANGENHVSLLLEQLNFFTLIVSSKQVMDREDGIMFAQIEAFLRGITCLSYSYLHNRIIDDIIKKTILSSSETIDKAKHLKLIVNEIGPQFPLFKFPKTDKLGFLDLLCTNLGELVKHDPGSILPVKNHIAEIQLHLKSLTYFARKILELDFDEHPEFKDLSNRVSDIAYKLEYVIESIHLHAQWQHVFWFFNLLEELRLVSEQASGIHSTDCEAEVQNVTRVSLGIMPREGRPAINKMVVDLSDEERVISDLLTRGSLRRGTVSIVGMPGIGKTTLAWKIFNSKRVMYHFHRCAWCTVSQVYQKKELLLEILSGIHGLTDEIYQMSNEDLESKLRQCLLKNKYLIVMDDVWDAGAWNYLQNSFPDEVNGSRILITSRLCDVTLEIEPHHDPHSLRPFSDDESWKLLEGRVFQGEACPQELLVVGKEIARKCEGLPLAVVAISGLLQRTEKRKELWGKIADSLGSGIIKDPQAQYMEILALSYKCLPGYLKTCFLYLGVFFEDKDIPVSKLTRFWLAEGFVEKIESKNLEDVAEAYLVDLINRGLVIISKRRSNGTVKTCRLRDLIRDFCQSRAKEENFLQLVSRCDEPYSSFPPSDYGFEFDFDNPFDSFTYDAYRLSIFLKRSHFVKSRPSGPGTRSLIFCACTDSEPRCPYDISFICLNFKFLRVLDFECINIGVSFPVEIGLLVLLRYLAVSGYMHYIPQSIANLSKLETLVVKGLLGKVFLPGTIWCMTRLRHLHVNIQAAFNLDDGVLGELFELTNLVSLSCLSISCGEDPEKIMKRLPNLRRLKCIFFGQESSKNCNQFPRLNFLTQLDSLNILYCGRPLSTSEFNLPLNLKELTLSNFRLPWDCISAIGRLPKLEVLKLLSGAFEGPVWEMRDEEFQVLKFLKLHALYIAQWNANCDHLPKLERLVLQKCRYLEEIPSDFACITTLEMIEVHWCGRSVENSAREIGEIVEEITVLITSSYLRS